MSHPNQPKKGKILSICLLLRSIFIIFLKLYVCLCVGVFKYSSLWRPEASDSPETGVKDSNELSSVGGGNQTQVSGNTTAKILLANEPFLHPPTPGF